MMTLVNCLASHLLVGSAAGRSSLGIVVCLAARRAPAGFVNGCVVVYGRIQPIIATLATGAIYIGIALFLRPTPGGDDRRATSSWALTNDLNELAATYGSADDGEAAWFEPLRLDPGAARPPGRWSCSWSGCRSAAR